MRKLFAILLLFGFSTLACAEYSEGVEYELLKKAQPAPTNGKVEVIEFFSYACPHCYRFEPHVQKWKAGKADNVEFIAVPAVFSKSWETLATLFYTAEALGVQDKLHPAIFEAMHGQGKKARSLDDLKAVFINNGVSEADFNKALNSFTVAAKTRRAKSMTKAYGIESVPNIVVQGKYRTNGTLAGNHENVFKVVDYLSAKISKE